MAVVFENPHALIDAQNVSTPVLDSWWRCPSNGLALESLTVALCLGEEEPHLVMVAVIAAVVWVFLFSQSCRTTWMAGKRNTIRGL
jgi:hypothetical protein